MFLEMKKIVMDFGPVRAVDHADLAVKPGEIVGLLGENGAGKSTLMNVLAGVYQPLSGQIMVNGKKVIMKNVRVSEKAGIRFIHQELNLCRDLCVYENMFLGNEINQNALFIDKKQMIEKCIDIFKRMNIDIDPEKRVEVLPAAEKQLVEIGKVLLFRSELIIMDEPSTALGTPDIENLFRIMRQLKEEGVSFIYISHKMPELFEICDTYYIMRDGKSVSHGRFSEINEEQVTEMMIGHDLQKERFDDHRCYAKDEVILSAQHISSGVLRDISFDLHKGEILAVTGLQGCGRDTLADLLFGVESFDGTLKIKDRLRPNHTGEETIQRAMQRGIAMVPRSRAERGIHNDLSVQDNLYMGYLNTRFRGLFIRAKDEKERFERQKKQLGIKVSSRHDLITSLSGGNQQKVILGKWLETEADVLLLDNPTQGIDVGTKFEIYHLILELARAGKAIIVFSAEYPEIEKVADSVIVLYKGSCNKVLTRGELTEKNVMFYSTGANLEGEK